MEIEFAEAKARQIGSEIFDEENQANVELKEEKRAFCTPCSREGFQSRLKVLNIPQSSSKFNEI